MRTAALLLAAALLALLGWGAVGARAANEPRIVGWGIPGNLGLGAAALPVAPTGLVGAGGEAAATGAAVGADRSFAVTPSGVLGTGSDSNNGLGAPVPSEARTRFHAVPGTAGATAVSTGTDSTLVLQADGTVVGFGRNRYGSAGLSPVGTVTDGPAAVSGLSGVTAIGSGERHSLALEADGTVWTWGRTDLTQTAAAAGVSDLAVPVQVTLPAGTKATKISAGFRHNLVLVEDGAGAQRVVAWGQNTSGEIGDGTTTARATPVSVFTPPTGTTVIGISAGSSTSFVLLSDGTFRAWGANASGTLGLGNGAAVTRVPTAPASTVPASAYPPFVEIQAGGSVVARTASGDVFAWGSNLRGLLGGPGVAYAHEFPYAGNPNAGPDADQGATEIPQRIPKLRHVPWLAVGPQGAQQIAPSVPVLQPADPSQDRIDFLGQPLGTVSSTRQALWDSRDDASTIKRVRIVGAAAEDFSIVGFGQLDLAFPYTVAANGPFSVRVRFTPTEPGERHATLRIEAEGETATVALSGYGSPLATSSVVEGPPGPAGAPGPAGVPGRVGLAGRDGVTPVLVFAASRAVTTVRRGRTAALPFVLVNGTASTLARTTATASVPKVLRVTGKRSADVAALGSGRSRTVAVRLKIGNRAALGTHKVAVRLEVGSRSIVRTVKVRVTR